MLVLKLSKKVSTSVTLYRLKGWYQELHSSPSPQISLPLEPQMPRPRWATAHLCVHVKKKGGRRQKEGERSHMTAAVIMWMRVCICEEWASSRGATTFLAIPDLKKQTTQTITNWQGQRWLLWLTNKTTNQRHKDSSVVPRFCTNMLAGDKSIFYLLLVPRNMWKKERPV